MTELASMRRSYPWTQLLGDVEVTFRTMTADDRDAVLAFTGGLPERDLLFLRWDITSPDVVDAWIRNIERERTITVLALEGEEVIGYCSLHHSRILWTRHLGEMRVLVGPGFRGKGIGGELAQQVFGLAQELELQKLVVQMMSTQRSAQNIFHHLGSSPKRSFTTG
ncbi:MAG: GNAT family N-acetyltransferase [Thermoanaerobaculia bacterium]|nr:GNAT family N-acetyltransferase [Thermoanaerobaculia bacterium]